MANESLGDRMKNYENSFRYSLPIRMPVIIRVDGCHFSNYTQKCKKPIDENLVACMNETAMFLCKNVQGCKLAYVQSDEISLLLNNYTELQTQAWFDNTLSKMVSVSAGMASAMFTSLSSKIFGETKIAVFDSRAFVLPKEEVCNAFIFRQQDATRNSIQMLARSLYSHSECNNKNCSALQELCMQKGINWNDCPTFQKRGRCIVKAEVSKTRQNPKTGEEVLSVRPEWIVDNEIPIFSNDRDYIEKHL